VEALVCEICSSAVPPDHVAAGRAAVAGNKVRCERCSKRVHVVQTRAAAGSPVPASTSQPRLTKVPNVAPPVRPRVPSDDAIGRPQRIGSVRVMGKTAAPPASALPQTIGKPGVRTVQRVANLPAGVPLRPNESGRAAGSSSRRVPAPTGIMPAPRDSGTYKPKAPSGSFATAKTPSSLLADPSATGRQKRQLFCHNCGLPLETADLTNGAAQLREGVPWCQQCVSKQRSAEREKSGKPWLLPAVAAVIIMAATVMLAPGAFFFVLSLLAVAGALFSLCVLDWPWTVRLSAAGVGLLVAAGGIYQITQLREARELAVDAGEFAPREKHIDELLASNEIRDAQSEYQKLKIATANPLGGFKSAAAEQTVERVREAINHWLEKKYPDSNDIGRQLILAFSEAFAGASGSKLDRFQRVTANGGELEIAMQASEGEAVSPGDGPESFRRYTQSAQDAWTTADYVFSHMSAITELHLELKTAEKAREIRMTRQQYDSLRKLPYPAATLTRQDWENHLSGEQSGNIR
jgi:hypothetical protein